MSCHTVSGWDDRCWPSESISAVGVQVGLTQIIHITLFAIRERRMTRQNGTHIVCRLPHSVELLEYRTLRVPSLRPVHFQTDPQIILEPQHTLAR